MKRMHTYVYLCLCVYMLGCTDRLLNTRVSIYTYVVTRVCTCCVRCVYIFCCARAFQGDYVHT